MKLSGTKNYPCFQFRQSQNKTPVTKISIEPSKISVQFFCLLSKFYWNETVCIYCVIINISFVHVVQHA